MSAPRSGMHAGRAGAGLTTEQRSFYPGRIAQFSGQAHQNVSPPKYWIVDQPVVTELISASTAALVATALNNPNAFRIYAAGTNKIPNSTLVAHYNSYAQLQTDIAAGNVIQPGTAYILFDLEANDSITPAIEQAAPNTYCSDAATLCHANGYKIINAPASDLFLSEGSGDQWTNYLNSGLIGEMAAYSDIVSLQMQNSALNYGAYSAAGATQVLASAAIPVLSGLTTTWPSSYSPTVADLVNQVATCGPNISGFWLNDTGNSDTTSITGLFQRMYG